MSINDHDDDISIIHGGLRLVRDGSVDALRIRVPATGILHPKSLACPVGEVADPIASHTGVVLHHCFTAAKEAVDQGGFTHVRATDDRDSGQSLFDVTVRRDAVFRTDFFPLFVGIFVVFDLVAVFGSVIVATVTVAEISGTKFRFVKVFVGLSLGNHLTVIIGWVEFGVLELGVFERFVVLAVSHRALLSMSVINAPKTSSLFISEVSMISASSAGRSGLVAREESSSSRRITSANTVS